MNLKLVSSSGERLAENSSIPPAISRRALKAIKNKDLSLEAAEAKLEFAEATFRDINQRIEKLTHNYK